VGQNDCLAHWARKKSKGKYQKAKGTAEVLRKGQILIFAF
jgi:hypothetical protein